MARIRKCNMCGKEILLSNNLMEGLSLDHEFVFGSRLDSKRIELDLCDQCLCEEVISLTNRCVISPIVK